MHNLTKSAPRTVIQGHKENWSNFPYNTRRRETQRNTERCEGQSCTDGLYVTHLASLIGEEEEDCTQGEHGIYT